MYVALKSRPILSHFVGRMYSRQRYFNLATCFKTLPNLDIPIAKPANVSPVNWPVGLHRFLHVVAIG